MRQINATSVSRALHCTKPQLDQIRRGNYDSGQDYVLEYGDLRFTFNERDFTERVEQAAIRLGFVDAPLEDQEREDTGREESGEARHD